MDEQTPHVLGQLSRYLDGQLPGSDRRRVEEHLEACDSCRKHHEGLLSLRNLLQQTPSLMPQQSFFHAFIPSLKTFKILFLIGVAVVVLWAVRKQHRTDTEMPVKKAPDRTVPVPPARVQSEPPVAAQSEDPGLQDLRHLTTTLPASTTAPAEQVAPVTPPAVVPDTAPVTSAPPVP